MHVAADARRAPAAAADRRARDLHRGRGSAMPAVARRRARARSSSHENAPHAVAPARDELGARRVVGEHAVDRVGERVRRRSVRRAARRRRRLRGSTRRAPRPPGTPARHRFEQREAEAFVDRRVREHRGAVEQRARGPRRRRAPASTTRCRVARRAARSRRRRRAGPGRRDPRSRAGGRDCAAASAPNAPTRCGRFLRGSSVPIASTNGAPPTAFATSAASAASSPSGGTPERDHDEAARRRAGPGRRSPRSRRRRTPSSCARSRRARSPGARPDRSARTSGVHSSGIAHERAVVDAHERREPARRCEVVRRVDDLRRAQPPVDARHVAARPRSQQDARRVSARSACRAARRRAAARAAQAQRVRNERRVRPRARAARR